MSVLSATWCPPHAYVPGETPRHEDQLFDPLKVLGPDRLDDSLAWRSGLRFLARGYFWEAHEVLEAVWKMAPENSGEKTLVQGVIQLANARLKARMGKPRAAARLLDQAGQLLTESFLRAKAPILGLSEKDAQVMYRESRELCAL